MSIKNKAINGFGWTAFEGVFSQGVIFLVGIVLARLLTPSDFGLIGIVTVFISVTNALVEGGFGQAIIRKKNISQIDYNTAFYTNLILSIVLYIILFLTTNSISIYFEEPRLEPLLRYAGIAIIINALCIVQSAILTIKLNFRIISIIQIISSVVSSIIALYMAYNDYGIWSLIALTIARTLIRCIGLWILRNWSPTLIFSNKSFFELFNFSYKLLISTIVNTLYKNIYYFLIGKIYSPLALGYYTRAEQFQAPLSVNISKAISNISYPILASLQHDLIQFKTVFKKFLKFSVLVNFPIMLAIAAMAKPLVLLTVGEKWEPSIFYLQLLCVPGMLYPLQILNLNLLTALGYSDLLLKIEMLKKVILIPLVLITVQFSIEIVLYGLATFSILEYLLNSLYSKKLISYPIQNQIKDVIPYFLIALTTFIPMLLISFLDLNNYLMIVLQAVTGTAIYITVNELMKLKEYYEIKTKFMSLKAKINGDK